MLLVASYDFTGSVVVHVVGTEYGLGIVGTEGVELLQIIAEFGSDIPEVDFGIDVDYGAGLFRQNMRDTNSSKRSVKAGTFSTFMDRPAA